MGELFLGILNRSASAGWFILAIVLLRPLLKRAPKWINPLLWGLVGLRLAIPFSIESDFSLIPNRNTIDPVILFQQPPTVQTEISAVDAAVDTSLAGSFTPTADASANTLQILFFAAGCVWLVGVFVMVSYIFISHIRLSRRLKTSVLLRDNIYASENTPTPFVFGVFRPCIYLPFHLDGQAAAYVIAHEQTHIKRLDHISKLAGFLLLSFHWFNPLIWVAFGLLCRDVELACDERVIKSLSGEQRADYSQVLLQCSLPKRRFAAYPLAFGEIGVKQRVKTILTYKKPALWLTVTTIIISLVLTGCFLTDPKEQSVSDKNANSSDSISHHTIICTDPNCIDDSHNHHTVPKNEASKQDITIQTQPEDPTLPQESIVERSNEQPVPSETGKDISLELYLETVPEETCSPLTCTDPSHGHAAYCTGENCTDPTHNHKGVCTDTGCTDPEHGHEIAYSDTTRDGTHHSEAADDSNSHHQEHHG